MRTGASIILILAITQVGCNFQTNSNQNMSPQTVSIDSLYEVSIPGNLQRSVDMHDYATLQFLDPTLDFYVLGLENSKEEIMAQRRHALKLRAYFRFVERTVFEPADSSFQMSSEKYEQNGLRIQTGDYYAKVPYRQQDYDLFYHIAVYEGKSYYFQLVIWMPYGNHCEFYEDINGIEIRTVLTYFIQMPIVFSIKEMS